MKTRNDFDTMLNWSFFIILLLYVPPSVFGYLYFGTAVQSPILASIGTGYVSQIAIGAITLHIFFTLPIVNNPLNLWLEEVLLIEQRPAPVVWRILDRTVLLGIQAVVACTVPHFNDVMAFIGASTVSATIFFFPCFFYLQLYWPKIPKWEVAWIFIVLLFATLGSVIGMYSTFVQIYSDISGDKFNPDMWFFWTILGCVTYVGVVVLGMGIWQISNYHEDKEDGFD